jgi:hypothetical protein
MNQRRPSTILFLAANPVDTAPLRLDEESREIDEGLRRARQRERFEFQQRWALRPQDLQRAILDCEPRIIHFAGHGTGEQGIVLENEEGESKPVSSAALEKLFELYSQVECVLLNACYSDAQAQAIAKHIRYVIGMKNAIGDPAAIRFATGFYDALGAGQTIDFAFKAGCLSIQLEAIPEELTPVLHRLDTPRPPEPGPKPQGRRRPRSTDRKPSLPDPLAKVAGTIKRPTRGQAVGSTFRCSGTVTGMEPSARLWLAVEVGGCVWPKENGVVVHEDGEWSVTVFEDGVVAEFAVGLWLVDAAVDRWLLRWLERGRRSGNYEELKGIPGESTRRLDRVDGLRRDGPDPDPELVRRQRQWYENTSKLLGTMKQTIDVACTLEQEKDPPEVRARLWHQVHEEYMGLEEVLNEAKLLASLRVIRALSGMVDRFDNVSERTRGADERDLAANYKMVWKLTDPLERANEVVRTEWRRLSGLKS